MLPLVSQNHYSCFQLTYNKRRGLAAGFQQPELLGSVSALLTAHPPFSTSKMPGSDSQAIGSSQTDP